MTLKVTGLKNLVVRLRATKQVINPTIKAATKEAAEIVKKESEENAPVLTGELEASHKVNEVSSAPDVAIYTVTFNAINPADGYDYGVAMHESVYNLGPESIKKEKANGHIVGRKFLERAANDKEKECIELVRDATKRKIRKTFENV